MSFRVIFAFQAEDVTMELSINTGEVVYLIDNSDTGDGWVKVKNSTGSTGFVPRDYLELLPRIDQVDYNNNNNNKSDVNSPQSDTSYLSNELKTDFSNEDNVYYANGSSFFGSTPPSTSKSTHDESPPSRSATIGNGNVSSPEDSNRGITSEETQEDYQNNQNNGIPYVDTETAEGDFDDLNVSLADLAADSSILNYMEFEETNVHAPTSVTMCVSEPESIHVYAHTHTTTTDSLIPLPIHTLSVADALAAHISTVDRFNTFRADEFVAMTKSSSKPPRSTLGLPMLNMNMSTSNPGTPMVNHIHSLHSLHSNTKNMNIVMRNISPMKQSHQSEGQTEGEDLDLDLGSSIRPMLGSAFECGNYVELQKRTDDFFDCAVSKSKEDMIKLLEMTEDLSSALGDSFTASNQLKDGLQDISDLLDTEKRELQVFTKSLQEEQSVQ
jgi:hypothetical protein